MKIRTKELPQIGAFKHVRDLLYKERLWEISVEFRSDLPNIGISCDDRVRKDVWAYDESGLIDGWKGNYGGSYAALYSNDKAAKATAGQLNLADIPESVIIVELTRHWRSSWVTLYLNPTHEIKLLKEAPKDVDLDRVKTLLRPFKSLKSAYRQEPLNELNATTEELKQLVENGWIKTHKGKEIKKLDNPKYVGLSHQMYKYYDFAGAKITTEGKNMLER